MSSSHEKKKSNSDKSKYVKDTCDICANEVSSRKIIKCLFCEFAACVTCNSTFLMGIDDDRPRCMNTSCKKVWSYEFLADNFNVSFYNKIYRNRRADLLLQQQKSLLPMTQPLAERRKHQIESEEKINDLLDENSMLRALIKRNQALIRDIRYNDRRNGGKEEEKEERRRFVRACPRNNCRGFLSTALKCGICELYACKDCHEPKDNEHECNANTVETVKLLASDTKACPSCNTMIYKIQGCDQMYCTQCHTAFSWEKGTIERGVIHNPHFYAYQREQNNGVAPRVAGDVRCGGLVHITDINTVAINYNYRVMELNSIHRLVNHIRYVELNNYPNVLTDNSLEAMRVRYLLGDIDDNKWLKKLKECVKKQEKNTSINQILNMFIDTTSDILSNITNTRNFIDFKQHTDSIDSLKEYTNKALSKVGYRFGNVYPSISHSWVFVRNSKNMRKEVKKPVNKPVPVFRAVRLEQNENLYSSGDDDFYGDDAFHE